ncbi:MAG: hypothetical protein JSS83_27620 [Cyanobacteria bacterium SZAS LIN-3]|nr:hypothetical protein [Cyanobacteria bacterium SZAS LIN-3]
MLKRQISPYFVFAALVLSQTWSSATAAPPKHAENRPKAARPVAAASEAEPTQQKFLNNIKVPADMQAAIDTFVAHEAKAMGGNEYLPNRQTGCGKMSSCLADCYVVLYVLEGVPNRGSNNNTQFMAAFTYSGGVPLLLASAQVGGRGLRYGNLKTIGPDAIKLTTEFYLPRDPMSTPSGRGQATFVVADKHIIEMP